MKFSRDPNETAMVMYIYLHKQSEYYPHNVGLKLVCLLD